MSEADKSSIYVTYKWLIGTMLSTLALCLGFVQMNQSTFNTQLDRKVDKEVYNILCTDISEIKTIAAKTNDDLHKLETRLTEMYMELDRKTRRISVIQHELRYIPDFQKGDPNKLTWHELRMIP